MQSLPSWINVWSARASLSIMCLRAQTTIPLVQQYMHAEERRADQALTTYLVRSSAAILPAQLEVEDLNSLCRVALHQDSNALATKPSFAWKLVQEHGGEIQRLHERVAALILWTGYHVMVHAAIVGQHIALDTNSVRVAILDCDVHASNCACGVVQTARREDLVAGLSWTLVG